MFQFLLIGGHKASFLPFGFLESFENNLKVWLCFSREKKSITISFLGQGMGNVIKVRREYGKRLNRIL